MKKTTAFLLAAAVIFMAAASIILVKEFTAPQEPPEEAEAKTYSEVLFAEYNAAKEIGDYIKMNELYEENYAQTGMDFPIDEYDPTHNGLIYTYSYSVKVGKENIEGKLYIVSADVNTENLSITDKDFIAVDRRMDSDPQMVVLNSYRADSLSLIEKLCSLLLMHEEKYPTDWNRTLSSMSEEWQIHNSAYNMDYEIERSKDVNLNNNDEDTDWFLRTIDELSKT